MGIEIDNNSNNIKILDKRIQQPIQIRDKKNNLTFLLSDTQNIKIGKKTISFHTPNNISICLNKAFNDLLLANKIYKDVIKVKLNEHTSQSAIDFKGNDLIKLFDYFELMESGVIFTYTAVESFINVSIPKDYIYTCKGKKAGISEQWNKNSIERWMSTKDKLKKVLPKVFNIDATEITNSPWWNNFLKLQEIRDTIIHQKEDTFQSPNNKILASLLQSNIYDICFSGFNLIGFFCEKNKQNVFFPYGFCNMEIPTVEVDDFDSFFEKIDV